MFSTTRTLRRQSINAHQVQQQHVGVRGRRQLRVVVARRRGHRHVRHRAVQIRQVRWHRGRSVSTGEGDTSVIGSGEGDTTLIGTGESDTPLIGSGEGHTPRVGTGEGYTPRVSSSGGHYTSMYST